MALDVISDPEQLGFSPQRLHWIGQWMDRNQSAGRLSGSSVLLARDGQIVYTSASGRRSIEREEPYTRDTIARIYSMTKPVTSVALMQLVERGLVHLDMPISEFFPEFATCTALIDGATRASQSVAAPSPTLHQLLTHTSGLSYAFNPGVLAKLYADKGIDFEPGSGGLSAAIRRVAALPLAFQPGRRWEYSVGIDIIGGVIEKASGMPLDQYFAREILGPLEMADTSFSVSADRLDRLADCYMKTEKDPLLLSDDATRSAYKEGSVNTISGGGGLLSTLDDYFRFAEMLRLGGEYEGVRILSPRTIAFMRQNHLAADISAMGPASFAEMPMTGMGFGIGGAVVLSPARARVPGSVGDFSWGGIASTFFWIDPKEQITCVFFTQLIPSNSYPLRAELKAMVHAALLN